MAEFTYARTDIHVSYDKSRQLPEETLDLWLDAISQHVSPDAVETIVDLGCGTGRFTNGLSDRFSAKVYGVDPSENMLAAARASITSPPNTSRKSRSGGYPASKPFRTTSSRRGWPVWRRIAASRRPGTPSSRI